MKELDVLFGRFLDNGYDGLDAQGREDFERLLDQIDQDILAWFWGNMTPPDEGLRSIIASMMPVVDASRSRT